MKTRFRLSILILAALPMACAMSPYVEGPSLGENPGLLPLDFEAEIANGQFFLGPEDQLTVNFHLHDDLSRTYRVRNDGSVIMPLVGRMQATGSTREQFEDRVMEAYGDFLVDPLASIDVEYSPNRKVTVLGEVSNAAVLTLTSPRTTVLDIIASAGGIGADGDQTGVLIARKVQGRMTVRHYDIDALFSPDDPNMRTEIPYVQAGDVVYVLRTWEAAYNEKLQLVSDTLRAMTFAERVIINGPLTSEALTGDIGTTF